MPYYYVLSLGGGNLLISIEFVILGIGKLLEFVGVNLIKFNFIIYTRFSFLYVNHAILFNTSWFLLILISIIELCVWINTNNIT